jgi:hypothetical protein
MTKSPPSSIEILAARLTLLAMHAALGRDGALVQTELYVVPPGLAPLDHKQTILRLCELSKPQMCIGLASSGVVVLCCWGPSELSLPHHHEIESARSSAEWIRQYYGSGNEIDLVIRSGKEALLVTTEQLEGWFARYFLPFVQSSVNLPGPDAPSVARAEMTFSPAGYGGISGSPV